MEPSTENLSLTLNGKLQIAGAILDTPQYHPSLMQVLLLVMHPVYLPQGIEEYVVGFGETVEEKVASVLDNFLVSTLPPILESFSNYHQPALDFTDVQGTLWHPHLGPLMQQGSWQPSVADEPLWELVQPALRQALPDQKFSWLKIYLARNGNDLTIDCQLHNQAWLAPEADLATYVRSWPDKFLGLRQFLMLRRCDAFEH